jgi:hypothetical protein
MSEGTKVTWADVMSSIGEAERAMQEVTRVAAIGKEACDSMEALAFGALMHFRRTAEAVSERMRRPDEMAESEASVLAEVHAKLTATIAKLKELEAKAGATLGVK